MRPDTHVEMELVRANREPGTRVRTLGQDGIRKVAYEDTEHFRVTRDFLLRRERMLRQLSEDRRDAD